MFNDLTGSNQYVGNWPGVTVEKKEGKLKGHKDVIITDLPGIYSLSPYSPEEVITGDYLINEKPAVIINIVDGTNIEHNLYLTTQLVEVGMPVIIALNMIDIIRKNGDDINVKKLSKELGCEVIETSALKGIGSNEVAKRAIALAKEKVNTESKSKFSGLVEEALSKISDLIKNRVDIGYLRWYSIKVFEGDAKVLDQLSLDEHTKLQIRNITAVCENKFNDDCESIIAGERYKYIDSIIKGCYQKKKSSTRTVSDKIDSILTHRYLGLPIFAAIMFLIYYISVSTVGGWATDWVNDTLFESIISSSRKLLNSVNSAQWLSSLILDGIIAGVGAVLGFLPQMIILFFFLTLLEDLGYMTRVAFIMDKVFHKFGLSGKSVIPMLIGTGCAYRVLWHQELLKVSKTGK